MTFLAGNERLFSASQHALGFQKFIEPLRPGIDGAACPGGPISEPMRRFGINMQLAGDADFLEGLIMLDEPLSGIVLVADQDKSRRRFFVDRLLPDSDGTRINERLEIRAGTLA